MAARIVKCEKCGKDFTCKTETGDCWCQKYKLNKESLEFLKQNYNDCLCENCIKEIFDKQNAQKK